VRAARVRTGWSATNDRHDRDAERARVDLDHRDRYHDGSLLLAWRANSSRAANALSEESNSTAREANAPFVHLQRHRSQVEGNRAAWRRSSRDRRPRAMLTREQAVARLAVSRPREK
jgi:hypothetical protein